jgi:hypothetical protein
MIISFYDSHHSTYIIHVIKSRRVILVGHVARMMGRNIRAGFRWRNTNEKTRLEIIDVGVRILLK